MGEWEGNVYGMATVEEEWGNNDFFPKCCCDDSARVPISQWVLSWKCGGYYVCPACGVICSDIREYDDRAVYQRTNPYEKWWLHRGKAQFDPPTKGRYKEKFHYNERVSQWLMVDPEIPGDDWTRILEEAGTGKYGPLNKLTRSGVITITRNLGLQKYRERWKTILRKLNPTFDSEDVPPDVLETSRIMFDGIVDSFFHLKKDMPKSVARTKDGTVHQRERHNFPSYNYVQRKILEALGIYDFHREFPVPRSYDKLHALDDIMEKISKELEMPFSRSTVIKRPKIRKKKNFKTVSLFSCWCWSSHWWWKPRCFSRCCSRYHRSFSPCP